MAFPSAIGGRSQYVLAIAGATGGLGLFISKAVLQAPYVSHFSTIRLLTRSTTSAQARELQSLIDRAGGDSPGKLIQVDYDDSKSLGSALRGVDVFVNVLNGDVPQNVNDNIVEALAKNKVKVYIPSEFGLDERLIDVDVEIWRLKKEHVKAAVEKSRGKLKVVLIYTGFFLEGIGLWTGFDVANGVFTSVGSPNFPIAYTARADIASATARLAILSISPSTADSVPTDVRIFGSSPSISQIKDFAEKKYGKKIVLQVEDARSWKKELLESNSNDLLKWVRLFAGEGKFDYTEENHRELVNPRQSFWKWKTVQRHIEEGGIDPLP
ncbi:NAD(P)-binding protein [Sistotremastrum niveocremeum HHB9708]|uniref:NAD(P)-binding protein n=1 Tax=Sistotremastrum niveocremeum HHB9708 TaxID=1314777 RepID=A0A164S175_9AGAM|nr:NAD(P)-binding protein [Sistotremastrum niveocremeum HHB9708]